MAYETDLRVLKSKKTIAKALLAQLREHPFESVSVKAICEEALVRRSTFYKHFEDKYDLLSFTAKYVCETFSSHMSMDNVKEKDRYRKLMEEFLDFFESNEDIIKNFANSKDMGIVKEIFFERISRDLLVTLTSYLKKIGRTDIYPKLYVNFVNHSVFSAYLWWINEGKPISKEELIDQLYKMVMIQQ